MFFFFLYKLQTNSMVFVSLQSNFIRDLYIYFVHFLFKYGWICLYSLQLHQKILHCPNSFRRQTILEFVANQDFLNLFEHWIELERIQIVSRAFENEQKIEMNVCCACFCVDANLWTMNLTTRGTMRLGMGHTSKDSKTATKSSIYSRISPPKSSWFRPPKFQVPWTATGMLSTYDLIFVSNIFSTSSSKSLRWTLKVRVLDLTIISTRLSRPHKQVLSTAILILILILIYTILRNLNAQKTVTTLLLKSFCQNEFDVEITKTWSCQIYHILFHMEIWFWFETTFWINYLLIFHSERPKVHQYVMTSSYYCIVY